jgi:hypothetical protein
MVVSPAQHVPPLRFAIGDGISGNFRRFDIGIRRPTKPCRIKQLAISGRLRHLRQRSSREQAIAFANAYYPKHPL